MKHEAALAIARAAAERAGALIRARWETPLEVQHKGEVDLVTEVDLAAEAEVLSVLRTAFPQDRIVAEESGGEAGGGRVWYVDPLDGTTNFSHGLPHFCVSIGLVDDDGPLVGVIHEPIRRWTFHAVRGGGAWRDGHRLRVTSRADLGTSLLATGFPYDRRTNPNNNMREAAWMIRRCVGLRRAGAAALDMAYVAAGWLDGYWEGKLKAWDIAAGTLLVTEAGGTVTGLYGEPLDLAAGHVTASNGHIHAAIVDELLAARQSGTSAP